MRHVLSCVALAVFCGYAPAAEPAPYPHEPAPKVTRYIVTVTSEKNGKIANINLRGDGLPKDGLDFKADTGAYGKKIKELVAKHKEKPPAIDMEISGELVIEYVVQLFDASIRAGVTDVSPVPLDPTKR